MGLGKADGDRMIIGVLALQGSFREHCNHLRKVGADAKEVCKTEIKILQTLFLFSCSKALALIQKKKRVEEWPY